MVFDLESVQEAIEEAVDRLSQKISGEDGPIWEKEPEKAAVLQALPKEIAHLEKWVIRNRDIATELQYQLDDAVKEIEGLQLELTQALKDLSSKDEIIKKLKKEVKQFKRELKTEQRFTNSYIKRLHDAEAKIEKLEEVKE